MNPTVSLVITAKDEAGSIRGVIDRAHRHVDELIVVDGFSTDATAQIAQSCGAILVQDTGGGGKGLGIRTGLDHVHGEHVVFMDADGSHNPDDIPKLLAPLRLGCADMVIGSRMKGGSDELHGTLPEFIRLMGNEGLTLIVNYHFRVWLTDTQNGFRALKTGVARDLSLRERMHTIELEMVMKCLNKGYRIVEVPTHEYRRQYGASKLCVAKIWPRLLWCLITNW